jgi:hypothetical protein
MPFRRRLRPKPPDPPPGYVWFYWRLVPVEEVEKHARGRMARHDRLSRRERDAVNEGRGVKHPKSKRRRAP